MSVFKKIVGFLFEEEEEILEEGEIEPIEFQEEIPVHKPRVQMEETVPKPLSRPMKEQVVEPVIPVVEKKQFTSIELTPPQPKEVKERPQRVAVQRSAKSRVEPAPIKQEFEFTPVISPIFGADEKTVKMKKKSPSIPKERSTMTSPSKKNPLGTIISPIYGATELDEFKVEAEERLHVEEEALAKLPEKIEEPKILAGEDDDHDIVSVPLEDLLAKEETAASEEDLLQISLFGDNEVVSTDKEVDSYTIKE